MMTADAMTPTPSHDLTLYGTPTCADCRRSRALLHRLGVEFRDVDISGDEGAAATALSISGRTSTPVILLPDGSHLVEPTDEALEIALRAQGLT